MELLLIVLTLIVIIALIVFFIFMLVTKSDEYYHEDINLRDVVDYMDNLDCSEKERAAIAKAVVRGDFKDDRDNT